MAGWITLCGWEGEGGGGGVGQGEGEGRGEVWDRGEGEAYFLHFPSNDGDLVSESVRFDQFQTVDGHAACLDGVHLPSSCLCSKERENACPCSHIQYHLKRGVANQIRPYSQPIRSQYEEPIRSEYEVQPIRSEYEFSQ